MENRNYSFSFDSGTFQGIYDPATTYVVDDIVKFLVDGRYYAFKATENTLGQQPDINPATWKNTSWSLHNGTGTSTAEIGNNLLTVGFHPFTLAPFDATDGFTAAHAAIDVSTLVNPLAFRARIRLSSATSGELGSVFIGLSDDWYIGSGNILLEDGFNILTEADDTLISEGGSFVRAATGIVDGSSDDKKFQLTLRSPETVTVVDTTSYGVLALDGTDWLEISYFYGRVTARYGSTTVSGDMPTLFSPVAPGDVDDGVKHTLTPYVIIGGVQTKTDQIYVTVTFDDFYVESILE